MSRVVKAQSALNKALGGFKKAHEGLLKAEQSLNVELQEIAGGVAELKQQELLAKDQLQQVAKVKGKLAEFLV